MTIEGTGGSIGDPPSRLLPIPSEPVPTSAPLYNTSSVGGGEAHSLPCSGDPGTDESEEDRGNLFCKYARRQAGQSYESGRWIERQS